MRRSATALTIGLAFALAACGGSDNPTAAEVPETPAATPTASEAASATPTETASLAATASASSVPGASAEPSASASPPAASGLDPLVVPATATDLAGTGAWAAWPEKENVEGTDGEVVRAFAQDVWTSGDGMRIAYSQSSPSNTDCPSGTIVVANLTNNQFECSYDEAKPGAYYAFALSGDGRTVAFQTDAKLADKSSTAGAAGDQINAKNRDTREVEPATPHA
ncbi:MAG: hypothetical protein ACT4QF_16185, partial [Sporichthyaceae bacterium]